MFRTINSDYASVDTPGMYGFDQDIRRIIARSHIVELYPRRSSDQEGLFCLDFHLSNGSMFTVANIPKVDTKNIMLWYTTGKRF